jgi:hypothetical protein
MITLGATYKDTITDYDGVAVGYVQYLTGCNQALLVPKIDKDGKRRDGEWFDEQRLNQVGKKVIALPNSRNVNPGFDQEAPKQ